jgi:hypothetical protein
MDIHPAVNLINQLVLYYLDKQGEKMGDRDFLIFFCVGFRIKRREGAQQS